MVLIGRSSDRSGERILHLAVPTFIGALGFIATGLVSSPIAGMIAILIAAVGDYGTRGPFWALPGKFLAGGSAAAAIALINSMARGRRIRRNYAVGYLKDATGSFRAPLFLLAGVLVVGSVLALFLRKSPVLSDARVDARPGSLTSQVSQHTMKTTIYGIKNCDTMKKARAWLEAHGVAHEFHDYKAAGIERAKLEAWLKASAGKSC